MYYKKISSPLGEITLRSDGESLTGLWFADDKHYGDKIFKMRKMRSCLFLHLPKSGWRNISQAASRR